MKFDYLYTLAKPWYIGIIGLLPQLQMDSTLSTLVMQERKP